MLPELTCIGLAGRVVKGSKRRIVSDSEAGFSPPSGYFRPNQGPPFFLPRQRPPTQPGVLLPRTSLVAEKASTVSR